jgi:hypothetical protein
MGELAVQVGDAVEACPGVKWLMVVVLFWVLEHTGGALTIEQLEFVIVDQKQPVLVEGRPQLLAGLLLFTLFLLLLLFRVPLAHPLQIVYYLL